MYPPACRMSTNQPQPPLPGQPSHVAVAPAGVVGVAAGHQHPAGGRGVDRRCRLAAPMSTPLWLGRSAVRKPEPTPPAIGAVQPEAAIWPARPRRRPPCRRSATVRAAPPASASTIRLASSSCLAYASGIGADLDPLGRPRSAAAAPSPSTLTQLLVELRGPRTPGRHPLRDAAPARAAAGTGPASRGRADALVRQRQGAGTVLLARLRRADSCIAVATAITQPRAGTFMSWPTLMMMAALRSWLVAVLGEARHLAGDVDPVGRRRSQPGHGRRRPRSSPPSSVRKNAAAPPTQQSRASVAGERGGHDTEPELPAARRVRVSDAGVMPAPSPRASTSQRPSGATSSAGAGRCPAGPAPPRRPPSGVGGSGCRSPARPARSPGRRRSSFSVSAGVEAAAGRPATRRRCCPVRPSQAVANRSAVCSGVGSPGRVLGDGGRRAGEHAVVTGRRVHRGDRLTRAAAQPGGRVDRAGDQPGRPDHAEDQHGDHSATPEPGPESPGEQELERSSHRPSPRLGAHPGLPAAAGARSAEPVGRSRTTGPPPARPARSRSPAADAGAAGAVGGAAVRAAPAPVPRRPVPGRPAALRRSAGGGVRRILAPGLRPQAAPGRARRPAAGRSPARPCRPARPRPAGPRPACPGRTGGARTRPS